MSSTATTRPFIREPQPEFERLSKVRQRYLQYAANVSHRALGNEVRIEPYTPYLTAPSAWLQTVEARIRGSVIPQADMEISSEWLSEDAANAAISFFRNGSDLLPVEPHIYATEVGDLVAEFETPDGNITGIVTDNKTILFAVPAESEEPVQQVIRRGSNQFRDELRSFTQKLAPGAHGKVAAAR